MLREDDLCKVHKRVYYLVSVAPNSEEEGPLESGTSSIAIKSLVSGFDDLLAIRLDLNGTSQKIDSLLKLIMSCRLSVGAMLRRISRTLSFLVEKGWIRQHLAITRWVEKTKESGHGFFHVANTSFGNQIELATLEEKSDWRGIANLDEVNRGIHRWLLSKVSLRPST